MKKIAALILISLLVVLSFDVIPHHAVVSPSPGIKTIQPLTSPPVYSVSITLVNTQGVATVKNFTQPLKIDWHQYAQYLNSNISNVRFYNSTNFVSANELYGWIEDNNTTGAVSSNVWVNLLGTIIPPYRGIIIYMAFLPVTSSWSAHWGLAAELSTPYGKFDNGASVFIFYDNFRGTTLSSAWTVPSGSDYTVNNGFIATLSAGTTTAVYDPNIQETSSIIAEWGLNMSSTSYPNTNAFFQLNRYTSYSNTHLLGVSGADTLDNDNDGGITTVSILSTGTQIFGIWNDGTKVTWYYEGNSYTDTSATAETDYLSLGWAYSGQSYNFPTIYWVRTRAYPPNGVMPLVTRYGPVNATLTVPITLVNKQSAPTVVNFTQQINVDWKKYSQYADGNISNVRFYNSTTYDVYHELYAWIQNNNTPNATSSTVWVNLSNTIVPSNGYATIYMVFLNKSALWSPFWGLAAPLEKTYGKHDDGFRVFKFYDNFKGTTLSPVWTVLPNTYSSEDMVINNYYQFAGEAVLPQPIAPPYNSNIKETSSIIVDWLLNMSTGLYNTDSTNQYSAPNIQLNRYNASGSGAGNEYVGHANSSEFLLGVQGQAVLAQNSTNLTIINVSASGDQVFGLWNDGSTVTWYYDGTAITYSGLTPESEYLSLAWAPYYTSTGKLSASPEIYWTLARYYPPDGVMPQVFSQAPPTTVSFTETTLPAGTTWGVTITNSSGPITQTTIGQSINFTNLFGSYTYSIIVPGGYTSDPSSGSFAVNGTTLSYPIYFALQQYAITFTEQGLKPGTVWSVTLNGLTIPTNVASITYYEMNGAYQFSVGQLSYYDVSPASGTVTVSNSNVNVEITFTHLWIITITETGLPPGTKWAVNYAGKIYATTTGVINLTVPEGNVYWYVVGISNYSFSPSGWENYVGHNYTVAISFSKAPANPLSVFTEYDTFILILAVALPISLWLIFRRRRE